MDATRQPGTSRIEMISEALRLETPDYSVSMTFEVFKDDAGRLCCGIYKLEGRIDLPPKAWLRAVRFEIARLEVVARSIGCTEMRIAGRDWSRILPDFEPFPAIKNGLRK